MGARGSERTRRRWVSVAATLMVLGAAGGAISCAVDPPSVDPLPTSSPPPPLYLDTNPSKLDDPCDGVDNNGNGLIDEACYCHAGERQSCYPGPIGSEGLLGACRKGEQRCTDISADFQLGLWGSCDGAITPQEEICGNSIDEDCDGVVEPCLPDPDPECVPGAVSACYPGPDNTPEIGICAFGESTCTSDETWGECIGAVLPQAEICGNDIDEDCDGEDRLCDDPPCTPGHSQSCYDGPAGTQGVGLCSPGSQLCDVDGKWLACEGAVLPATELCGNGLDENCDGTIDSCQ